MWVVDLHWTIIPRRTVTTDPRKDIDKVEPGPKGGYVFFKEDMASAEEEDIQFEAHAPIQATGKSREGVFRRVTQQAAVSDGNGIGRPTVGDESGEE